MAEILKTLSAEQLLLLSKTYSKCLSLTLAQWGNLILFFDFIKILFVYLGILTIHLFCFPKHFTLPFL